jgi:hypothetical protein
VAADHLNLIQANLCLDIRTKNDNKQEPGMNRHKPI